MKAWHLALLAALLCLSSAAARPAADASVIYLSPRPGAIDSSALTSIALRADAPLSPDSVRPERFAVSGSHSGSHSGRATLARDGVTALFYPDRPFAPGESVRVTAAGLRTPNGADVGSVSFSFQVSPQPLADYDALPDQATNLGLSDYSPAPSKAPQRSEASPDAELTVTPDYKTITETLPSWTINTLPPAGVSPGKLFIAPFAGNASANQHPALLMLDEQGQLVYYKAMAPGLFTLDFKLQPDNTLSYFSGELKGFAILDNTYTQLRTIRAGNGYPTDHHELQILPNGNALLMIYHTRPQDLSSIGGRSDANVIDTIIQEIDPDDNVVFEWNSKDYFEVADTYAAIDTATVDYAHGNAIELDADDSLLISNRHVSEITKIDRQTGAIIWRLGGKNNEFTFLNSDPFHYQHDIRRLPNGHITLFNNRTSLTPAYSQGEEYVLDETNKTIEQVWSYSDGTYGLAMGNMQRLANGNSVIGWGTGSPSVTEVTAAKQKVFELTLASPYVTYRAFRFPWVGRPTTDPALVALPEAQELALYTSWNGATEVAAYRFDGGLTPDDLEPIQTASRDGFETRIGIATSSMEPGRCFYRAVALDSGDAELGESPTIYSGDEGCPNGLTLRPNSSASRGMRLSDGSSATSLTLIAPSQAVSTTTTLIARPADAGSLTANGLSGMAFELTAFRGLEPQTEVQFEKPLTIALTYDEIDFDELPGRSLRLFRYDESADTWTTEGVTLLSNDTSTRQAVFQISQTGRLALAAQPTIYLPVVGR